MRVIRNRKDEAKSVARALHELSESSADFRRSIQNLRTDANATRKLWRSQNRSLLIKVGLVLIAFPDPTISDVVGSVLVAAGMVQAGIRRRTLSVEDVPKELQSALAEIKNVKEIC